MYRILRYENAALVSTGANMVGQSTGHSFTTVQTIRNYCPLYICTKWVARWKILKCIHPFLSFPRLSACNHFFLDVFTFTSISGTWPSELLVPSVHHSHFQISVSLDRHRASVDHVIYFLKYVHINSFRISKLYFSKLHFSKLHFSKLGAFIPVVFSSELYSVEEW